MTRKHFVVVAETLGETLARLDASPSEQRQAARDFAVAMRQFNGNFKTEAFVDAVCEAALRADGRRAA